jgi:hypothetical protein
LLNSVAGKRRDGDSLKVTCWALRIDAPLQKHAAGRFVFNETSGSAPVHFNKKIL